MKLNLTMSVNFAEGQVVVVLFFLNSGGGTRQDILAI